MRIAALLRRPGFAVSLSLLVLAIYGLGGLIAPFIGIKAIDLIITTLGVS